MPIQPHRATSTDHQPIEREPRRVRPPYDVRDESFDHITPTDRWRAAIRADRLAALRDPLAGLEVTAYELGTLEWLCGWETSTVAVVAGLLHRCRAADPIAADPSSCADAAAWLRAHGHTDDLCGVPAGQSCEPWCPSWATEEGAALLDTAAPARSGLDPVECVGCGHDFDPDSSPHIDRCWSCAEQADAEAGESR